MASPTVHRAQILGAALLFSTGGAAIKATSLGAWQVAGFRSGVAALALGLTFRSGAGIFRARTLAVGLAYAATLVLFVSANKLTTAANAIFLQSTAPIYVLAASSRLLGERVRRADGLFALLLGVGLALFFVGVEPMHVTAPRPALGNLLGAISGVTWAATLVGLRWLGRGSASPGAAGQAVIAGNLIACLTCLPFALPVSAATGADWLIVLYLGVFQIGLAYVLLTRGVLGVSAIETSLLILLEPVANALLAWLLHGERPGPSSLAGCVVILGATLAHTLISRPPRSAGAA